MAPTEGTTPAEAEDASKTSSAPTSDDASHRSPASGSGSGWDASSLSSLLTMSVMPEHRLKGKGRSASSLPGSLSSPTTTPADTDQSPLSTLSPVTTLRRDGDPALGRTTEARIHLAGDSTVAPGPLDGSGPIGWGGVLHEFVDETVVNRSFGGATTSTFQTEGRWRATRDDLRPGDWVLLQFGHNDQKDAELRADGGYRANLERFISDTRARKAHPVLVTSLERRIFDDGDGALVYSHGPYPGAVRALGRDIVVPVIDLTSFSRWLYTWLGPARSLDLFPFLHAQSGRADTTHFGITGARLFASYVAESLRAIRGLDDAHEALGTWG
jgi:lysophospholipase L1-like esterase